MPVGVAGADEAEECYKRAQQWAGAGTFSTVVQARAPPDIKATPERFDSQAGVLMVARELEPPSSGDVEKIQVGTP